MRLKFPRWESLISEATISRIIKASGSVVRRDEEILELETDKVNQVLYAPQAGQLSLSVKVGDSVKIGQVLGTVDTDVQAPSATPKAAAPAPAAPEPVKAAPASTGPSARKMAPDVVAEMKSPKAAPVGNGASCSIR